jgi:hypothetical protein
MPPSWPAWEVFLYNWQAKIAGGVALLVGVLAFVAALRTVRAINKQIAEARQGGNQQVAAIKEQVAAIQAQITDRQARDKQLDERRLADIEWSVSAEGGRLVTAAALKHEALDAASMACGSSKDQWFIETSALLRGEREGIELLDDGRRGLLHQVASVLDDYNQRIATAKMQADGPDLPPEVLSLIGRLEMLAIQLRDA